jgi:hypothetical protein
MGHENSYQIAIKTLFWPKCWIASYNTQEAIYLDKNQVSDYTKALTHTELCKFFNSFKKV